MTFWNKTKQLLYQDFMAALELGNDTFTLILWKFGQTISLSTAFGWGCKYELICFKFHLKCIV